MESIDTKKPGTPPLSVELAARQVKEMEIFKEMVQQTKMQMRRDNYLTHLPYLHANKEDLYLVYRKTPSNRMEKKVGIMIHIIRSRLVDEVEKEIASEKKAIKKRRPVARRHLQQ